MGVPSLSFLFAGEQYWGLYLGLLVLGNYHVGFGFDAILSLGINIDILTLLLNHLSRHNDHLGCSPCVCIYIHIYVVIMCVHTHMNIHIYIYIYVSVCVYMCILRPFLGGGMEGGGLRAYKCRMAGEGCAHTNLRITSQSLRKQQL